MASSMTEAAATENVVVVAVRAEREISKTALAWALTHVVRPGDVVTLLAVLPDHQFTGWRQRLLWGFSRLGGSRGSRRRESFQISASCSQMALQIDGRNEINVRIKVVGSEGSVKTSSNSVFSGANASGSGVVAAEARRVGATWVVLDKELRREEKQCMEELQCNIVVMRGSTAKVLRLNVGGIHNKPLPPFSFSLSSSFNTCKANNLPAAAAAGNKSPGITRHHDHQGDAIAARKPSLSPNLKQAKPPPPPPPPLPPLPAAGDGGKASLLYVREQNNGRLRAIEDVGSEGEGSSEPNTNSSREASPGSTYLALECDQPTSANSIGVYWVPEAHRAVRHSHKTSRTTAFSNTILVQPPQAQVTSKSLKERLDESKSNSNFTEDQSFYISYANDVREAVSLFRTSPSVPPPLCSLCRHKAPAFGQPPRPFAYRELEAATDGFSDECFVAEGPSGCVFRGVLEDGRVVAVKQLKTGAGAGEEGEEEEFRAEVEVLSRAQHRNVVMLVGFCMHAQRRMLVYEYICHGSMDLHLYDQKKPSLDWRARVKIAAGVARGLRYLHEDCRVGFVVHKDLRPNNILLTHDYEPLIGDFKLTKWQTETSLSVDTNIPEAFGYLAPEYIEHGIVTDKSDVYAFGVIMLELITGRRAMDAGQPKGQQFLAEWARPLLSLASEDGQTIAVDRFLDPCLDRDQARFFSQQLRAMVRAASLCLRRDPQTRPGMSKVLRVLEGENVTEADFHLSSVGSRSSRIVRPNLSQEDSAIPTSGSFSFRIPEDSLALFTAPSASPDSTWPK